MGKESPHLQLQSGVGLIGRHKCGSMLYCCGHAFVYVYLEVRHHLVYNGVGLVEAGFVDSTSCLSEFKVSFAEVVLEVVPHFVCLVCVFPCSDVIFEDPLLFQYDKGEVD